MPDDSDETPPRASRPRPHWNDDERIAVGAKHRAPALGVPIGQLEELAESIGEEAEEPPDDQDVTGPQELYELGPLTPREAELWQSLNREKRANRARAKRQSNDLLAAMGDRPPNERIAAIERRVKLFDKILVGIATLALGSVITVAKGLYERGAADGAAEMHSKDLERRIEFLERGLTPDRFLHSLLPLGGPQP